MYLSLKEMPHASIFLFGNPTQHPRRATYEPILSKVRRVMINKMAKPEEVIIVEDENGELIREYMKDVNLYQTGKYTS